MTVPTIGRSLLGDEGYEQLKARLKPGQQAVVVAGDGVYSFKGSGYVRGGIFDRIELLQDGSSTRFRDRNHTRLGNLAAEGAPELREIGLFVTPEDFTLELTEPWQLQLLVQRAVATREKAFIPFEVLYTLPERYLTQIPNVASSDRAGAKSEAHAASSTPSLNDADALRAGAVEEPLWLKIWKTNAVSIAITSVALGVLTVIFFFQDWLVRRPPSTCG